MNRRLFLLLCFTFPALADDTSERMVYACDNGSRIEISFSTDHDERPLAHLHFADASITLPQVPTASGVLYRNAGSRLYTRGTAILFEDDMGNRRQCSAAEAVAPAPSGQASGSFLDISGRINYRSHGALPPHAILIIRLRDGRRTLAEQRIELSGQPLPIPFQTTVDRDLLRKNPHINLAARIEVAGKILFRGQKVWPAPGHGEPAPDIIELNPGTTPRPIH